MRWASVGSSSKSVSHYKEGKARLWHTESLQAEANQIGNAPQVLARRACYSVSHGKSLFQQMTRSRVEAWQVRCGQQHHLACSPRRSMM
eukprot:1724740-Amphidinium_carterae.1